MGDPYLSQSLKINRFWILKIHYLKVCVNLKNVYRNNSETSSKALVKQVCLSLKFQIFTSDVKMTNET